MNTLPMPEFSAERALIVPFAAADDDACRQALAGLALPALQAVLTEWSTPGPVRGDAYSRNAPHEHALAAALGWDARPDGLLPLAAWHAGVIDRPCAWLHLCHWTVGMEQVSLQAMDPASVPPDQSRALLATLAPLAAEDGLTLVWEQPTRWRAEGEPLRHLPWPSLDRVAQRRLDGWLPDGAAHPAARPLLRLLNEAQMLFYTHPVHDERAAQGLPAINGLWIDGCGTLQPHEAPQGTPPQLTDALRRPALHGDWAAWRDAWQTLDREAIAPRLRHPRPGPITLCGESHWQTWAPPSTPSHATPLAGRWRQALRRLWRPARPVNVATVLQSL